MKIIADLCIVPMGVGPSVSRYVRAIKPMIDNSGLNAQMHPNGTNLEGEMAAVTQLVERCCAKLYEMGVERVFCTMVFSSRRDKEQSMEDKLKSVEA